MSRCGSALLFRFGYERGWDYVLWLQPKSLSRRSPRKALLMRPTGADGVIFFKDGDL